MFFYTESIPLVSKEKNKKIKKIIFLIICLKTMTILYINLIYVLFSTDHVENLSTTGIKIQKAKYR